MTDPTPKPARPGPAMYLVPAWMAVFGAVLVACATALLVWNSPAVGLVAVFSLIAVLLAALGATPASVQNRIGKLSVLPEHPETDPREARPDPASGPLVKATAINRVLDWHGLSYTGPDLPTGAISEMADRYYQGTPGRPATDAEQEAAVALDGLVDRALQAIASERTAATARTRRGATA